MRAILNKLNDILSWIMMIGAFVLLIYTGITVSDSIKTGEGAFVFGYRPVLVLSGSMEPYMMTNGICLTKEVNDIDELNVDDVVTFHLDQNGKRINITHRIISIENGIVNTKGDNNNVPDNLSLTMDNIDAKVVFVFNQSAWLVDKWQTTTGKVMIISFSLFFILAYILLSSYIKSFFASKKNGSTEEPAAPEYKNQEDTTLKFGSEETSQTPPSKVCDEQKTE